MSAHRRTPPPASTDEANKTPARWRGSIDTLRPSASASRARETCSARSEPANLPVAWLWRRSLRASFLLFWLFFHRFRAEADVVRRQPDQTRGHRQIAQPLERLLPQPHTQRNLRILGKAAVALRMLDIVQHINHVRAAHAGRIIHARVVVRRILPDLLRALAGQILHVILTAEMQTPCRARLDAGGLQPRADAIRAQSTLVHLFRRAVELRYIEGAASDAVLASNAVLLLKIDDAVRILHDRAVGRTRQQTSGIGAVHALILAH